MRNSSRPPSAGAPFRKPVEKKARAVYYPPSDKKPLAETDIHFDAIQDLKNLLKRYYRDRDDVYVAAVNFIFYTEGKPKDRFSPDVYVVFGVEKKRRRSYFLWKEKHTPSIAFEITSRKSMIEDATRKKDLYEELRVKEYILCDPEADYLQPPLQGFRLVRGKYRPIPQATDGSIHSEVLCATLRLENEAVSLYADATGQRVLSADELARAETQRAQTETQRAQLEAERAQAETERAKQETLRASAAEERSRAAEAENARLREELERLKNQLPSTRRE